MKKFLFVLILIVVNVQLNAQQLFCASTIRIHTDLEKPKSDGLLFNFNPVLPIRYFENIEYVDYLGKNSTIIMAFRSQKSDSKPITRILNGKSIIEISSNGIDHDGVFQYRNANSSTGLILSYQFGLKKAKKGNIVTFKDFVKTQDTSDRIIEFFYFPDLLSPKSKKIVETYLSIKYGISLHNESVYINSFGDTIWDPIENKDFCNNVTGIGRDDSLKLYQKQSCNSNLNYMSAYIDELSPLNSQNKGIIENNIYYLWGHNGEVAEFALQEDSGVESMARVWKMQRSAEPNFENQINLRLHDKTVFNKDNPSNEKILWFISSDSSHFPLQALTIIKQKEQDSCLDFKGVKIKEEVFFSFLKAPDLFFLHEEKLVCESFDTWNINIKIIGGKSPYVIKIQGTEPTLSSVSESDYTTFKNLKSGEYSIEIRDFDGKFYSQVVNIDKHNSSFDPNECVIAYKEDYIEVSPPEITTLLNLSYEWSNLNGVISNDSILRIKLPGEYSLKIKGGTEECESTLKFSINPFTDQNQFSIFPNPVLSGEPITISLTEPEKSDFNITICDADGRVILQSKINDNNHFEIHEILTIRGRYFVILRSGNRTHVGMFIVI